MQQHPVPIFRQRFLSQAEQALADAVQSVGLELLANQLLRPFKDAFHAMELFNVQGIGSLLDGVVQQSGGGKEDVDGDDFKQELNKAMPLGAPERQTLTADGTQRLTVWKYADGESLMLADATPIRLPGIYLTLMHKIETSR